MNSTCLVHRPWVRRRPLLALAAAAWLPRAEAAAPAAPSRAAAALVSLLQGEATLLRGTQRLALAEGVRLQADDIIETAAATRCVCIEFADGRRLALGPDTRAALLSGLGGGTALNGFVLQGWAKLAAAAPGPAAYPAAASAAGAASAAAAPAASNGMAVLALPALDLSLTLGATVAALLPAASWVFAESAALALRAQPGGPVLPARLQRGELLELPAAAGAKPVVWPITQKGFLQGLPRAFMDVLPQRPEAFKAAAVAPRVLGELVYADAQPWLDGPLRVRRALLARWKPLGRQPAFRQALVQGMKAHPEWQPILFPPAPASTPAPAPAAARAASSRSGY